MNATEIIVLVAGIASIAFVLWYFFGERERVIASVGAGGVQEVKITVKGGYDPDVIVVKQNQPLRLDFYRDETGSCSDRVGSVISASRATCPRSRRRASSSLPTARGSSRSPAG